MIFEFMITLKNQLTGQETRIAYNDLDYLEGWKNATNKAIEELKGYSTEWYIESIKSFLA